MFTRLTHHEKWLLDRTVLNSRKIQNTHSHVSPCHIHADSQIAWEARILSSDEFLNQALLKLTAFSEMTHLGRGTDLRDSDFKTDICRPLQ